MGLQSTYLGHLLCAHSWSLSNGDSAFSLDMPTAAMLPPGLRVLFNSRSSIGTARKCSHSFFFHAFRFTLSHPEVSVNHLYYPKRWNYYHIVGIKPLGPLRDGGEGVAFSFKIGEIVVCCSHFLYPAVFQSYII
jgi:hypothetical protein